jgi:hypothetical protein
VKAISTPPQTHSHFITALLLVLLNSFHPRYPTTQRQMATLSTLRFSSNQPHQQRFASSQNDNQTSHSHGCTLLRDSILHSNDIALPIGNLFGRSHSETTSRDHVHFDTPTCPDHDTAPSDGPEEAQNWSCCYCGAGPISVWQNCCASCNHKRSTSCCTFY